LLPGGRMVSVSQDQMLRLWDRSGGELWTCEIHSDDVRAFAMVPDRRIALTGSWDRTVKIWDLDTRRELRTLEGHEEFVSALASSADGRRVVSGSGDHTLNVWDLESGFLLRTLKGHEATITAVAVWDKRAVSASTDGTVRTWDLESGRTLRVLACPFGDATAVAVDASGGLLVSGHDDGSLRIWDLESGAERTAPPDPTAEWQGSAASLAGGMPRIRSLALAGGCLRAVTGDTGGMLKVWDLASGELVREVGGHRAAVHAVAASADGRWVCSGSVDGTLGVWDFAATRSPSSKSRSQTVQSLVSVQESGGDRGLSGSSDDLDILWRTSPELCCLRDLSPLLANPRESADAVAVAGGRRWRAASSSEVAEGVMVEVRDSLTGESQRWKAGFSTIHALAVSEDGERVATGCGSGDVTLWDVKTASPIRSWKGTPDPWPTSLAFTAGGRSLVAGWSDGAIRLWETESGSELWRASAHRGPVGALAVSPDNKLVVSGGDDALVAVRESQRGELVAGFWADEKIAACALTRDGETIVAGDASGGVHFLRIEPANPAACGEQPCPQLTWEVESLVGRISRRLPFVIAVLADLGGRWPGKPVPPLGKRKFLGGGGSLEPLMQSCVRPRVELELDDRLGDGSPFWAELVFESLEQFKPDSVVRQSPRLACRLSLMEYGGHTNDGALARQLDDILHHARFQQLEATWRGLVYLSAPYEDTDLVRIRVLDATKQELVEDLAGAGRLEDCVLYRLLRDEYDSTGGQPAGVLLGAFEFGAEVSDLELLEKLSALGAKVHAPFITSAAPSLFGSCGPRVADTWTTRWNAFRRSKPARYAALALPRFLVRQPYKDYPLLNSFYQYTESGSVPRGNPAFVLGRWLIESFLESGWWVETAVDSQTGRMVDLPGCLESVLDSAQRATLQREGFVALSEPVEQFAFLESPRSCFELRTGAGVPSLVYILNASRIIHSLAKVASETGWRSMTRENCEALLNGWLGGRLRAAGGRRPWMEAVVRVEESPEAGWFRAVLELRPGPRMAGSEEATRLAVDLPSPWLSDRSWRM